MKKRWYIIIAAVLMSMCFLYNLAVDSRYVLSFSLSDNIVNTDQIKLTVDQDKEIIKIIDQQIRDNTAYITAESVSPGEADIMVEELNKSDSVINSRVLYVHQSGIITEENFFGRCTGSWSYMAAIIIFLAVLIIGIIIQIKKEMRRDLYQYKNVRNIGFALFLTGMFVQQILLFSNVNNGIIDLVKAFLESVGFFSGAVLPLAFVIFILVTISNIKLMINEGRNWRNFLGCILGILVCFGTIFPFILSDYLQWTSIVDVHNQNGIALYIELLIENTILIVTSYFECVLIGTIILSTKAARKIPSFDKDYILILGCQINKDGTLTKLLKSRADRAIEFAKMQKEATGKEIVFVPSGGKGDDEIISEGDAIKNYLVESGIPAGRILVENESANTNENLRNSMELIKKDSKTEDPKIAFSTTNYHVFRSGYFASQQGIKAEGIGAKTKRYFWINAFIREYIAALVSEWKTHAAIIVSWIVLVILMIGIVYFSNNYY